MCMILETQKDGLRELMKSKCKQNKTRKLMNAALGGNTRAYGTSVAFLLLDTWAQNP